MQLSWQPGFSLSRKPRKRTRARHGGPSSRSAERQRFHFVTENPREKSEAEQSLVSEPSPARNSYVGSTATSRTGSDPGGLSLVLEDPGSNYEQPHDTVMEDVFESGADRAEIGGISHVSLCRTTSNGTSSFHNGRELLHLKASTSANERLRPTHRDGGPEGTLAVMVRNTEGSSVPFDLELSDFEVLDPPSLPSSARGPPLKKPNLSPVLARSISPTVVYNDLHHRMDPILDRYNSEFCKIPLTAEFEANPFRYCDKADQRINFLLHAVMALAGHHVRSSSTQAHRQTSLQLLRTSLNESDIPAGKHAMLDAITILFSLDETQSLYGSWKVHLTGAFSILEACGGLRNLSLTARDGAQVGLFVWWDSILSLVSREDCVFPYHYCTALMSYLDVCQWDFFRLCGCPSELAGIVFRLARIAAEKYRSLTMQYVHFDTSVLWKLKHSLEAWQHVPSTAAFESEEQMHRDRDQMHCSEAWRHGLLLYIYRIFEWEVGNEIPIYVCSRARDIVEHVLACRDDSMLSKQALLPLFFAGCELRDHSTQRRILELCNSWDHRTRYHMFLEAGLLLEEVWAEQERLGFENVWWGQIVDSKHRSTLDSPIQTRICFG